MVDRRKPRKRSAPQTSTLQRVSMAVGESDDRRAADQSAKVAPDEDDAKALLQEFQALLSKELGIDKETREAIEEEFLQAWALSSTKEDAASNPRHAWNDALVALKQGGAIVEDDAIALERQLNEALRPLESRESRLALEFSRRIAEDGEDKALEWFRAEACKSEDEQASRPDQQQPNKNVPPLRAETVNSRSRRLRGPPRR